ncbi:MAG TPA: hypothetical protein VGQ83_27000 [Polyangia bacterium]
MAGRSTIPGLQSLTLLLLLASAPASAGEVAWAIPADQGPAVFALLPAEGELLPPTSARIRDVEIRRSDVQVCAAPAGGAAQCVTLVHPSAAGPGDARTRFFAVRKPDARAGAELARAVAASVAAREREDPWRRTAIPLGQQRNAKRGELWLLIGVPLAGLAVLLLGAWTLRRRLAARRARPAAPPSNPGDPA